MDINRWLHVMLQEAEQRVVEKPEVVLRAVERLSGAVAALRVAGVLDEESTRRWLTVIAERLPYELPADERSFSFKGGGHAPGALCKSVSVAGAAEGLLVEKVLVFSEGVGLLWSYRPSQPWDEEDGPPFGGSPDGWPAGIAPAPPAFSIEDDCGTLYRPSGWSLSGSHAAWSGESRFVPQPPEGAGSLRIRFRNLTVEATL